MGRRLNLTIAVIATAAGVGGLVATFLLPTSPCSFERIAARAADQEVLVAFANQRADRDVSATCQSWIGACAGTTECEAALDEFEGLWDLIWRTPEALSREFVFRLCTPGMAVCIVASERAERMRVDADAALTLTRELKSPEGLQALADCLWSDAALDDVGLRSQNASIFTSAASNWGAAACPTIAELDRSVAIDQMRECAQAEVRSMVAASVATGDSLASLIGRVSVRWRGLLAFETDETRARELVWQRLRAQSAAITLATIADARLAAITEIRKTLAEVTPKRVEDFLNSMTGLYDAPATVIKSVYKGQNRVVSEALEEYVNVLSPAGLKQLADRVRDQYNRAAKALPNRILDECDGDFRVLDQVTFGSSATQFSPNADVGPVATRAVLETALLAADSGLLVAEIGLFGAPEPWTKIAGVLLVVGDVAWESTQVTPRFKRRTEVMAHLHNEFVCNWLGTTPILGDVTLADGTVVYRQDLGYTGTVLQMDQEIFTRFHKAVELARGAPQ